MPERGGFELRDGDRVIRFGPGVPDRAADLLEADGRFTGFALLHGRSSAGPAGPLRALAGSAHTVASGPVAGAAAELVEHVGDRPLVAVGGGRVIDVAKALAARAGTVCAAVPTTLSGAPFTPIHRLVPGAPNRTVRPVLVLCDPDLMTSLPGPDLAATAMNALAHGIESLYAPYANPAAEALALRGIELFRVPDLRPTGAARRAELATAAMLAGSAIGMTGLGPHHALCQAVVGVAGAPHAATNAVVLPHSARGFARLHPRAFARLGAVLPDLSALDRAAAATGVTRLRDLAVTQDQFDAVVDQAVNHRWLVRATVRPGADALRDVLRAAW